jgi:hypothetical protein
MLLSDWRGRTPHRDSMTSKVMAVVEPLLEAMGSTNDPTCFVVWGDDPAIRYMILIPTDAGLLQVHVRVNVPQEGPRASAKLLRWHRVQLGELALESLKGHRLISFQVEGQVLRGSDEEADEIAAFALSLYAAIDGRSVVTSVAISGDEPVRRSGPITRREAPPVPQLPSATEH